MVVIRRMFAFALLLFVVGCNRAPDTSLSAALPSTTSNKKAATILTPPSDPHDVRAWQAFMHNAVQDYTKLSGAHPYSYLVPGGLAPADVQRRKDEAMAIRMAVRGSVVPGNMIVVAGPDSGKIAEVLVSAFQKLPNRSNQGLKVLFVGVPQEAAPARKVVEATGAELKVLATGVPQP